MPVPLEGRRPRLLHACFVAHIQRHVQAHAKDKWQQPPAAKPEEKECEKNCGGVKPSRGRVLRRVCSVEEMHGHKEIEATLMKAEPDIMVDVDKHGARPET